MRFLGHCRTRRRQKYDGYSNNKSSNCSNTHPFPVKSAILILERRTSEVRPQVGSAELSAGPGLSARPPSAGLSAGPSTGAHFFSCEGKMKIYGAYNGTELRTLWKCEVRSRKLLIWI
jgi:hypothetical protein